MDICINSQLLNELRKTQELCSTEIKGFFDIRPQFKDQMEQIGERTIVHMSHEWGKHIRANLDMMRKWGSVEKLHARGRGKTFIVVGASPDLKKNVDDLREIHGEFSGLFHVCCVNSAIRYLQENGIQPHSIIIADSDELIWERDIKGLKKPESLMLFANSITHPTITHNWKGQMLFIPMLSSTDEEANKLMFDALGSDLTVPGGGNAFNLAMGIAVMLFDYSNIIFVGNSLSWKADKGEKYFVDEKESNDDIPEIPKFDAVDVNGELTKTTTSHYCFKLWIEDIASKIPSKTFINATEGGILGVNSIDGFIPWIHQMKLKDAIGKVKESYEIMKDWRKVEKRKYDVLWMQGYNHEGYPEKTIAELKPQSVLDVGCGNGSAVKAMKEIGIDAYGCDISQEASKKWDGVRDKCYLAFAHNLPFRDNRFDLVTSDILEHIPEDWVTRSIQEMKRVSNRHLLFMLDFKEAPYLIDNRFQPHQTVRPSEWWKKTFRRNGLNILKQPTNKTFILERR